MTRLRVYKGGALDAQDSLLRRQVIERQSYERWERRERIRRQAVIVGLVAVIAAISGFLGFLAGAGR